MQDVETANPPMSLHVAPRMRRQPRQNDLNDTDR